MMEKQRLLDACKGGHFEGLPRRTWSSVFEPDLSHPLHYAAALGNLEVVRELIEKYKCDPIGQNVHGITPLHCASYCGKIDVVKYLQKVYGIDTVVVDKVGGCPIAYCAYCTMSQRVAAPLDYFWCSVSPSTGHVEIAKYLLSLRVQNTKKCTSSPQLVYVLRLPMHCNSLADFKHIIEILTQLEFQADSIECKIEIYRCLRSAVCDNKWDFVRTLLLAFPKQIKTMVAASDTEDLSSQSFLHTLFDERADVDLIKPLLDDVEPNLCTLKLIIDRVPNCFEFVQYLLETADNQLISVMDTGDSGHFSLLPYVLSLYKHKACEQRLVKLIAEYGADSRDIDGNTVLHLACEYSVVFLTECNNDDQISLNKRHQIPLHIACKHGNLEIIKLVSSQLQSGLDMNIQDSAGNTPLHIACKSKWNKTDELPCFRYLLLEKGCSINIQNNQMQSPLHILLRNHNLTADMKESILAMCSERDVNINAQDNYGMTLLHIACGSQSLSMVCSVMSNFQCDVNLSDSKGNLPLHYAVKTPNYNGIDVLELVKLVSEGCTQIHTKNNSGITPLHTACSNQNKDVVKYLVFHEKYPLNVNNSPANNYDNLDVHFLCQKDEDMDLLKVLVNEQNVKRFCCLKFGLSEERYGEKQSTPLHIACAYNNVSAIRLFGELNCNFSVKDSEGLLPIHIACSKSRSLECVVEIVEGMSKQCIYMPDDWHYVAGWQTESHDTPLHFACKAGALDIVKYLIHKCNCRQSMILKNDSGKLPVHYACEHSLEMVQLVAQQCTTEELIVSFGSPSVLDVACYHGFVDIAVYLINQKGFSLSALNGNQSALLYAIGIPKRKFQSEQEGELHQDISEYLIAECGYDPCMSVYSGYDTVSLIHYACQKNSLPLVKSLTVCSVDIKDSEGNTPLHYACKYSCVEIVRFLVDRGCDQAIINNNGELALHLACQESLIITQMLTKCDVNTLNFIGNAPIHIACSYRTKDDIAVYLIEEAKCDINIPDINGSYALHMACLRSLRITKLLLQSCDVNCKDADGNTALHIVCSRRSYEFIACLLENNLCRADIPNKSGELPLHKYINHDCTNKIAGELQSAVTELLIDRYVKGIRIANREGFTPIQIAVIKGKIDFLHLLQQRNDLDLTSMDNKTLLHTACKYRQVHMVRWMLDHGADASIPDEEGNYPEHLSIEVQKQYEQAEKKKGFSSHEKSDDNQENFPRGLYTGKDNPSLKTLTELGVVYVHKRNKSGNTVLHIACQEDRDHILQHVLFTNECTDAFSIPNNDGNTPLHLLATRKVKLSTVLTLIRCKNVNVRNKFGNTPLHVACQNNNIEFATFLLVDLRCDTNIKNDKGEIPLHIAVSKSFELVKLIATSETINAQRNDGDTPLHIACQHEQLSVVLYLIIDLNCSITITNNNDDSPIHILLSKTLGQNSFLLKRIPKSESDRKNKDGDTLLHVACRYSTISTVSFLIRSLDCHKDSVNKSGVAPLHFACSRGIVNMVQLVSSCNPLAQMNDLSKLNDIIFAHGDTPLHVACRTGKVKIVKYLLKYGHARALCVCNKQGELPFHLACQFGDINMVRPFVRHAPVFNSNTVNLSGDTPLHIACRSKCTVAIIKLLVGEMNCKINLVNKNGDLPLHIACRNVETSHKLLNMLCVGLSQEELILQNVDGNTALHELLRRTLYESHDGHIVGHETLLIGHNILASLIQRQKNTVKHIVQGMPAIDVANKKDEHPIHLACQCQALEVVKILCEEYILYQMSSRTLPEDVLHKACLNEDPSICEYLMNYFELDANIPNKNGDLPLHIAAKQGCLRRVGLLMKKTLNVNYANHQGNTPIHELYIGDDTTLSAIRIQILNTLMENGVLSFSTQNSMGQTPLHYMAARYHDLCTVISKRKIDVNIQDNEDRTPLHVACQANQLKCIELLLSAGADISLKDKRGQTPIALTKKPEILKLFLTIHEADPQPVYDMHRNFFEGFSGEVPPPTPAKLIVIGDPSVGKTTLVHSLRNEGSESVISEKFNHTTGIVTTTFSSKIYGDVKFFDFAGQPEYYASHDGFLHSILKNIPPTVLIVVNLTKAKTKIRNQIHYWINFIENRCAAVSDATHIIIVCSHADILLSEGGSPLMKVSKLRQSIASEFEDKKLVFKDILHINCTISHSEEMMQLQQVLRESTNELREEGIMHINSHCFYCLLLQTFRDCKIITLGHIISKLKIMSWDADKSPLFLVHSDQNAVIQMCKDLDDKGHIMFIEHPFIIDKSWLILDTQPLLHDLLGTLFAPSSFPQHRPLSYSTGIVPLSLFKKYIREQDSYTADMLLTFLTRLEYCREVTDKVLLDSIVKQEGYLETEKYYFFPNLVSRDRPKDKWSTSSKYSYQCGWLIQCKREGDFFSPHFIQVLLLRLIFTFAPKKVVYDSRDIEGSEDESDKEDSEAMALVIKRTCSVWKNGLYWQERSGVKTIVDIIDQRTLILLMQCQHGSEIHLLKRRSMIMSMVHEAKEEFSSKSNVLEYFLHPQCVKHPLISLSNCRLFSFPQIELCFIYREPYVINDHNDEIDLEELLLFEPYFEFSPDVIKKLSNKASFHEHISNDLLLSAASDIDYRYHSLFMSFGRMLGVRVTDKLSVSTVEATDETQKLACILKQILTRRTPTRATHRDLHEFFNQMSIFYGRYPPAPQGIIILLVFCGYFMCYDLLLIM